MHREAGNLYYLRHPAVILKISFGTLIKSRIILYCLRSSPIHEESTLFW
jgi:hypothetical protein